MTDEVTLVVGAGKGIGRAVANTLVSAGSKLALIDIDAGRLMETAELVGGDCSTHVVDVRDGEAIAATVDEIESQVGDVTALAHVAGILNTGSILDTPQAQWREIYDVNVFGLLNVLGPVGRAMRTRRRGSIVVVGSNAAGIPRMSMGAYGSSKAASTMLTRVLGLELAQYGIRANIVAPGSTDTDMQRSLWADPHDEQSVRPVIDGDPRTFRSGIPLGRIATAEDIADAVAFLLSDRARHITMQSLYVDGGATLRG